MTIANKKAEILRLIEQLQQSPSPRPANPPARRAPIEKSSVPPVISATSTSSLDTRLERRRTELSRLKDVRDNVGLDLLEERLLSICQDLSRRIEKVEELVIKSAQANAKYREAQPNPPQSQPKPSLPPMNQPKDLDINTENSDNGLLMNLDNIGPMVTADTSKAQSDAPQSPTSPDSNRKYTLSGRIEEALLADIFQLISSNDKTGVFTVTYQKQEILLYFREGEVFHAETDGMTGQAAFFAAMAVGEGGYFYFNDTEDLPQEQTINANTQFLILEALRQIDEEGGGQ